MLDSFALQPRNEFGLLPVQFDLFFFDEFTLLGHAAELHVLVLLLASGELEAFLFFLVLEDFAFVFFFGLHVVDFFFLVATVLHECRTVLLGPSDSKVVDLAPLFCLKTLRFFHLLPPLIHLCLLLRPQLKQILPNYGLFLLPLLRRGLRRTRIQNTLLLQKLLCHQRSHIGLTLNNVQFRFL